VEIINVEQDIATRRPSGESGFLNSLAVRIV
jgi:hypothetical protein